jgi:hypothetical protein
MIARDMRDLEEKKTGLNADQLKRLKLYTYIKQSKPNEEDICSVCLIAVKKGDRAYELSCKHIFHKTCLEPWLKKSTVCPNCRRNIAEENYLPELAQSSPVRS